MNIIDAVKSKKNFKRKSTTLQYSPSTIHALSYEELLADDWEIEEEKIEVTESQLLHYLLSFDSVITNAKFDRRTWFEDFKKRVYNMRLNKF